MQFEILATICPVFLVILTGFVFGRYSRIFKPELASALIQFSFYVAVPGLLLGVLTTTPIKTILNWQFLLVYGVGSLVIFFVVLLVSCIFFRKAFNTSVIIASLSTITNVGFVALPLALALFGHKAVATMTLAILFLVLIVYPLMILLLEIADGKASEAGLIKLLGKTFKSIVTNPVVLPAIIGTVFSASGLKMPSTLENYFHLLAAALTPCALFAIGMGIEIKKVKLYFKDVVFITLIKLLIVPLIMFFIARWFHLPPFLIAMVVIAVAVPPAKTIYILAGQYKVVPDEVAATISFSTLLSIVSLFFWLILLAHLYPSLFHVLSVTV